MIVGLLIYALLLLVAVFILLSACAALYVVAFFCDFGPWLGRSLRLTVKSLRA